ncbi:MAG: UvrB/UvrC motif-containing protein [Bacillota bacterium]|nr:UvrB/UvrC motif-containing protein [Bacillota bacterium]
MTLCEECGIRPASVYVTRIVNGQKVERHLCTQCALEKGDIGPLLQNPGWILQEFLQALSPAAAPRPESRCPSCGLSWTDFTRTGFLGCPHCYEHFLPLLLPAIQRVQGADRHVPGKGEAPEKSPGELEKELQRAIREERYEDAARLRDAMRQHREKGGEIRREPS